MTTILRCLFISAYFFGCFQIYLCLCQNNNAKKGQIVYTAIAGEKLSYSDAVDFGEEVNKIVNKFDENFTIYGTKQNAIQQLINFNYRFAVKFKKSLQKTNKFAARAVRTRSLGFLCDRKFCKIFGPGRHSIGICGPYYCKCENDNPHPGKCGRDTVYDPKENKCNDVPEVFICGL